ncbi:MAG: type II toxin-antitoxin system RelE/ParE family toxin [Candidatus Magnetobacterium sp. LHC-1]
MFLDCLAPKQFRQIVKKALSLTSNPYPVDSKQLSDSKYRRVDIGEYRIIYLVDGDTLKITIAGKRNDDAVYKRYNKKYPR